MKPVAWFAPVLLLAALPAVAAPVSADALTPNAHELALQWTLASAGPSGWPLPDQAPTLSAGAAPAHPPSATLPVSGVPDPAGYALMGLGLLLAGLAVRHAGRSGGGRRRPGGHA